ncbi:MAG: GAF domain-containing protein [Bdellovibrionaceae bacterium]|nr:GAF domain-containing protein [Pseudobdellovibrionaceae bacterium]
MKKPPVISHEEQRLAALRGYAILDSAPEMAYDDIVKIASMICDTPIALISLVDQNRQWFKASKGVALKEAPREISFCGHAIQKNEIMQVKDATRDDRFFDNPFVTGPLNLRFYAGAPLFDKNGMALGTLCVGDIKARELTSEQTEALAALARQVTIHIEMREWAKLITQQQDLLSQQARMSALGQLAGEVAHEINTPLCSLTLGLDLIEERLAGQSTDEIAVMKRSALKISSILKNLLAFTRKGGRPTDLFRVVETTVGFHIERFRENGVRLSIDSGISGGKFPARVEAPAVSEALNGLLTVACDAALASPGDPWVRVSWRTVGEDGMLVVANSSLAEPSLPENEWPVEPLDGKAAGPGLNLSRQLMEGLGGQVIELENETHATYALVFPRELHVGSPAEEPRAGLMGSN